MTKTISNKHEKISKSRELQVNAYSSLVTGFGTSVIFNPWDRALYRSINYSIPFLSKINFTAPFQGLSQCIFQKTFANGVYFFLQAEIMQTIDYHLPENMQYRQKILEFGTGLFAGSIAAIVSNPMSAVKYQTWLNDENRYWQSIKIMWSHGGSGTFMRGVKVSVIRDTITSCSYELIRSCLYNSYLMQKLFPDSNAFNAFFSNLLAATFGTVISSPFNYVRSKQFGTSPNMPEPTTFRLLNDLVKSSGKAVTYTEKLSFFASEMKVGPNIIRTAAGVAMSQAIFDNTRQYLSA